MTFVYILLLQNNKYYVGRTNNFEFRFKEHFNHNGSVWTQKYNPIKLEDLIPQCDLFDEDKITIKLMSKHGIDNVRGGSFTQEILPENEKAIIQKMILNAQNKCFHCGEVGHFINECKNKKSNDKCYYCGEAGHFVNECKIKDYNKNSQLTDDASVNENQTVDDKKIVEKQFPFNNNQFPFNNNQFPFNNNQFPFNNNQFPFNNNSINEKQTVEKSSDNNTDSNCQQLDNLSIPIEFKNNYPFTSSANNSSRHKKYEWTTKNIFTDLGTGAYGITLFTSIDIGNLYLSVYEYLNLIETLINDKLVIEKGQTPLQTNCAKFGKFVETYKDFDIELGKRVTKFFERKFGLKNIVKFDAFYCDSYDELIERQQKDFVDFHTSFSNKAMVARVIFCRKSFIIKFITDC